jgi:hypothetical protein
MIGWPAKLAETDVAKMVAANRPVTKAFTEIPSKNDNYALHCDGRFDPSLLGRLQSQTCPAIIKNTTILRIAIDPQPLRARGLMESNRGI